MNQQPAAPLQLQPGQIWGSNYEIIRLLARGSVTEVYRAYAPALKAAVALKIMTFRPEDEARQVRLRERFYVAQRSAADLEHPNIGRIYDFGELDGRFFVAMELIEGPSLRDVLSERRRGLSVERALAIFQQVCDAVTFAHSQGITHQNIHPGNILLADGGQRPVIVDFGTFGALSGDIHSTAEFSPRAPLYMAPEQAAGETVGPRTDVYALGILLYEMVTGDVPFKGLSPTSVLVQHLQQAPRPPSELDTTLDPAIESAILKALSKQPEDRFSSPFAMLEAMGHRDDALDFDTITLPRELLGDIHRQASAFRPAASPTPNPTSARRREPPQALLPVLLGVILVVVVTALIVLLASQGAV
jgi:serine/threonine protein kinase